MSRSEGVIEAIAARGALVDGEWRTDLSGGTYRHHEPATGRPQADVGMAGVGDVERAVAAARAALPAWRDLAPDARAGMLFRLADLLEASADRAAVIGALENGTPVG